jgi:hypothetical protein
MDPTFVYGHIFSPFPSTHTIGKRPPIGRETRNTDSSSGGLWSSIKRQAKKVQKYRPASLDEGKDGVSIIERVREKLTRNRSIQRAESGSNVPPARPPWTSGSGSGLGNQNGANGARSSLEADSLAPQEQETPRDGTRSIEESIEAEPPGVDALERVIADRPADTVSSRSARGSRFMEPIKEEDEEHQEHQEHQERLDKIHRDCSSWANALKASAHEVPGGDVVHALQKAAEDAATVRLESIQKLLAQPTPISKEIRFMEAVRRSEALRSGLDKYENLLHESLSKQERELHRKRCQKSSSVVTRHSQDESPPTTRAIALRFATKVIDIT